MDHDWPAELDGDAKCYACGLAYNEWSEEENLYCPGEAVPDDSLPPFTADRGSCPKCAYRHETYIQNKKIPTTWAAASAEVTHPRLGVIPAKPERLIRTCPRCEFSWDEATVT